MEKLQENISWEEMIKLIKDFIKLLDFTPIYNCIKSYEGNKVDRKNPYVKTFLKMGGSVRRRIVNGDYNSFLDGSIVTYEFKDKRISFELGFKSDLTPQELTIYIGGDKYNASLFDKKDRSLIVKIFESAMEELKEEAKGEVKKWRKKKELTKDEELLSRLHEKAKLRRVRKKIRKAINM